MLYFHVKDKEVKNGRRPVRRALYSGLLLLSLLLGFTLSKPVNSSSIFIFWIPRWFNFWTHSHPEILIFLTVWHNFCWLLSNLSWKLFFFVYCLYAAFPLFLSLALSPQSQSLRSLSLFLPLILSLSPSFLLSSRFLSPFHVLPFLSFNIKYLLWVMHFSKHFT